MQFNENMLSDYIDLCIVDSKLHENEFRDYVALGMQYNCSNLYVVPLFLDMAELLTCETYTKLCLWGDVSFGLVPIKVKNMLIEYYCSHWNIAEINFTTNYNFIDQERWDLLTQEFASFVKAAHLYNTKVNALVEIKKYTLSEIQQICECAISSNVDYIQLDGADLSKEYEYIEEIFNSVLLKCQNKIKIRGVNLGIGKKSAVDLIDLGVERIAYFPTILPEILDTCEE